MTINSSAIDYRWGRTIGGTFDQTITDKLIDGQNNLIYSGYTTGIADLDPSSGNFPVHGTNSSLKSFISKMDTAGNIIWIDTFSGNSTSYVYIHSITTDQLGNIYATGGFKGTVDFDPGIANSGTTSTNISSAIFFLKLNAQGHFQWVKVMDGNAINTNWGFDIITSKETGILVAGTFGNGSIDFDSGPGVFNLTAPARHVFVAKYDYDGNFIWAKSYGGDGPEESCVMDTDVDGNIYLTGQFSLNFDFDPGPGVVSPYPQWSDKLYVSKWDKNGNFIRVNCYVGIGGSCFSNDIKYDGDSHLYVVGQINGSINFNEDGDDGTVNSVGVFNSFILRIDTAGHFDWVIPIDKSSANGCAVDDNKDVYVIGQFNGLNVDFDPSPGTHIINAADFVETYIVKYTRHRQLEWVKALKSSVSSRGYTVNLDHATNVYSGGIFSGTIDLNPDLGVDTFSAILNDFYIQKMSQCFVNRGINQIGNSLYAVASFVNYSWYNCDSNYLIAGANLSSYTPTHTGNYAVILDKGNGCIDTSDCLFIDIPVDTSNSINNKIFNQNLELYPNPSLGTVSYLFKETGIVLEAIVLTDIAGRKIENIIWNKTNKVITLPNRKGIYWLHLLTNRGTIVKQVVVAP